MRGLPVEVMSGILKSCGCGCDLVMGYTIDVRCCARNSSEMSVDLSATYDFCSRIQVCSEMCIEVYEIQLIVMFENIECRSKKSLYIPSWRGSHLNPTIYTTYPSDAIL